MSLFNPSLSAAAAEAELLHHGENGFVCVSRVNPRVEGKGRWNQTFHHVSSIKNVADALRGKTDIYMSQSTFVSKRRGNANAKSMRAVYVDLDTYNLSISQDPEVLTKLILDRAKELNIPNPSYIASSGRGMYAKWVFDQSVCASRMPQWRTLQNKLVSAYCHLGSDPKVVDAARVMRLQESINSKSNTIVTLVDEHELVSFTDMVRDTVNLPILRARKDGSLTEVKERKPRKGERREVEDLTSDEALTDLEAIKLFSMQREPVMLQNNTLQSLAWNRFLDLRDLVFARGGIHRGNRDITLFWMATFLAQSGIITPQNYWAELRSLLEGFPTGRDFNPIADGSMTTLLARIESQQRGEKVVVDGVAYDPIYTPRNDTLLNILQISPEEERSMRTIISSDEKLRRADLRNPGRAERRIERHDLREMAVSMKGQGVSLTDIARQLGRDRSTIVRWLQPAKNVGTIFLETRGRKTFAETAIFAKPGSTVRYKITGRGVVAVERNRLKPEQMSKLASAATARRLHTREEKPHLAEGARRWTIDQIGEWLKLRRQARATSELARKRWMKPEVIQRREAEAQEVFEALLAKLRRRATSSTQISISQTPCLSSAPINGPPVENLG